MAVRSVAASRGWPASKTGSRVPAAASTALAPEGAERAGAGSVASVCAGRAWATGAGMASSMAFSESEVG